MGLDFYTGLNTVPSTSQKTDIFNKTAINSDNVFRRLTHHGAAIGMRYILPSRTFPKGSDFLLPLEALSYDTDTFWSPGKPDRLSIPAGFSYVEVWGSIRYPVGNWTAVVKQTSNTNVSSFTFQCGDGLGGTGSNNEYAHAFIKTPIMPCYPGDYFELYMTVPGSGTATLDQTFLSGYSGTLSTELVSVTRAFLMLRAYV